MKRAAPFALTSLLGVLSRDEFLAKDWGHRPAVGTLAAGTMRLLKRELLGFDVPALVNRSGDATHAWFETLEGAYRSSKPRSPKDALALYDAGQTLYMPAV